MMRIRWGIIMQEIKPLAFGLALSALAALLMLLLGISGNLGIYTGAVEMMSRWHMFFSLSVTGIIAGMLEAAAISFISGYLFATIYNRLI